MAHNLIGTIQKAMKDVDIDIESLKRLDARAENDKPEHSADMLL